jgi:hypothetical protein
VAFDITKPVQESLTPEEKTWFDGVLGKAGEDAVTAFKTQSEEERKKSIPAEYEIKFADGTPLDPKTDGEKIVAHLKAQGFSTKQAEAHLAHLAEVSKGLVSRQQAAVAEAVTRWASDTKNDKELGGDKFQETAVNVKRAMDRFAPEGSAFRQLVEDTGYGNHPEFVRVFNAIGKAMAEDTHTILGSRSRNETKKDPAEILYDGTK